MTEIVPPRRHAEHVIILDEQVSMSQQHLEALVRANQDSPRAARRDRALNLHSGRAFALAIDAGGIRSVETAAAVIEELERHTDPLRGTDFDLYAGTSGGGIAACMLSMGYSGTQLRDTARRIGRRVFTRSWWQRIKSVNGLVRPKYDGKRLRELALEVFGGRRMTHLPRPTMVPTTDLIDWEALFLKSHHGPEQEWLIADALTATSAAPFYFSPFQGRYGDGGYHAYNPSLAALAEARLLWPNKNVTVLSLSSGSSDPGKPGHNAVRTARSIGGAVTQAQANSHHWLAQQFADESGRYDEVFRIDNPFQSEMDDVSDKTLDGIRDTVQAELAQSAQWKRFLQVWKIYRG